MPASNETKVALRNAQAALATAVVAVAAARELWNRDAPTDGRMGTTFPIPSRFPLEAPAAQLELGGVAAQIDKL